MRNFQIEITYCANTEFEYQAEFVSGVSSAVGYGNAQEEAVIDLLENLDLIDWLEGQ